MAEEEQIKDEITQIMEQIGADRNFLLSGGAGSGKTYTLVQTIREIIRSYPSDRIACITYTNAAVREIKGRVDNANLTVSTIHEFLWGCICNFQDELLETFVELANDADAKINIKDNPNVSKDFFYGNKDFEGVQYKQYPNLSKGIISHNEVLILAEAMFKKYPKLCDILKSRYPFIFVDEYQDTQKSVVKIFLECLRQTDRKYIVGFYGDSMQAIYDNGIGDLNEYLDTSEDGCVHEIQKVQNRRNPQCIIDLANKLRSDGLQQTPSTDIKATNMSTEGVVKQGKMIFLYNKSDDYDIEKIKAYISNKFHWDFEDVKNTKEFYLTHNLIARKANIGTLMEIHDKDQILKYIKERVSKFIEDNNLTEIVSGKTVGEVLDYLNNHYAGNKKWKPTKVHDEYINGNHQNDLELAKSISYNTFIHQYADKEQLIDDKKQDEDDINGRVGSRRSRLMEHLLNIEKLRRYYEADDISNFIKLTDFGAIRTLADKQRLKDAVMEITENTDLDIGNMIDRADDSGLCIIGSKLKDYTDKNPYIYERIRKVSYREVINLYDYLEGHLPYSTQHKTKGSEFDNVLVVLDNGKWKDYNFTKYFENEIKDSVTIRTAKIFYVCCTRVKEQLAVFFPNPSDKVLAKAKEWFGDDNVEKLPDNVS